MHHKTWINASAYDVRGDVDLDGDVDATDKFVVNTFLTGTTAGRGVLSGVTDNRRGYAGYTVDGAGLWHVRHRVLDAALGRWLRRDPQGYVDGVNGYLSTLARPIVAADPLGTTTVMPPPGLGAGGPGLIYILDHINGNRGKCCNPSNKPKPTVAPGEGTGTVYGWVTCCDGKKKACVDEKALSDAGLPDEVIPAFVRIYLLHELGHFEDGPDCGPGSTNGVPLGFSYPGLSPVAPVEWPDCLAFKSEFYKHWADAKAFSKGESLCSALKDKYPNDLPDPYVECISSANAFATGSLLSALSYKAKYEALGCGSLPTPK